MQPTGIWLVSFTSHGLYGLTIKRYETAIEIAVKRQPSEQIISTGLN